MISIYLDWNVIVQLKNGSHPGLKAILDPNRFLIPYSTSHIGDILPSYANDLDRRTQINEDLEFITSLTRDYCLFNDSKQISLDVRNPKELFQERLDGKDWMKTFSLDTLIDIVNGDERTKGAGHLIEKLKRLPLDDNFIAAFDDPGSSVQMNALFPGLKDDPTIEGFFKWFAQMIEKLDETEQYKILRGSIQEGLSINRDQIFNTEDPFRLLKNAYEKFPGDHKSFFLDAGNYAPAWFDNISNEYMSLDLHGYQEDKVTTAKGRKQTFRNTTEDAFHAAFASTCNFYITNDQRSYEKTKRVYEQLKLNTLVFKPAEFIEHYNSYLSPRSLDGDLEIPFGVIENNQYFEEEQDGGYIRTYHLSHFVLDFFNKMFLLVNKSGKITTMVLSKFSTNRGLTYFFEIEKLSPKLYSLLGMDSENLGPITLDELMQKEWSGRNWKLTDKLSLRFVRLNGHYQLYYEFDTVAGVSQTL